MLEDILNEYTGYDPPEQVKYFIKYAYDTWGIKYVMLVGGLKSHINAKDKDTRSAGWKALVGPRPIRQYATGVMMKGVYLIFIMDVCIMQPVGLTAGIRVVTASMPTGVGWW